MSNKQLLLRRLALLCRSLTWLTVTCFVISTASMARGQTADPLKVRITLTVKEKRVSEVLNEIRQKYDLQLVYPSNINKLTSPVTLSLNQADIKQTMTAVLKGSPLEYVLQGMVVLVREPIKDKSKSSNSLDQSGNLSILNETAVLTKDITGKVTDKQGNPLQGASIQIRNSQKGTFTNENGVFELKGVPDDAVLVITMMGYQQKIVKVEQTTYLQIVMDVAASDLDQVIVTGYQLQKKRSVTGSIVSVKGESIENFPVQSFDKAIQGRAAGVLVQTQTGVPGGSVRINIRGEGSINAGTEPMYIIDGVQLNSDAPTSRTSTNAMAYINPNDIESIEILKDAAAAAIYGSQAANGVILITTKRGKVGKTKLNLNYYQGYSAPPTNLKMLDSQGVIALRTEALINANPTMHPDVARAQALSELGLSPDLNDEEIAELPTYDWQSAAFRRGTVQNIEFSASGGSAKSTFYMSGAYNKHDGNVTGIDFEKATARLRLQNDVTNKLNFDMAINLTMIKQNGNTGSQGSTSGSASPQYTAAYMPPTVPIYNPDGSFNAYPGMPGTGFNPIQAATVDDNIVRHRALVGSFTASYKILPGLTFKSFYGIDYRFIRNDYYRDPRTPNGANVNGYLIDENIENINFTTSQTLNFKADIGTDHTISAILGGEYRSDTREYEMARGQGFPTYQYRTMQSAAEAVDVTGSWTGLRKLGFFSQVNYEFMDRYFISGTLRYDGS
ncbi:MAG TPA: SusC/RagA family TonB-linked outer membrane protein, partial [Parasegetibacter sp.]